MVETFHCPAWNCFFFYLLLLQGVLRQTSSNWQNSLSAVRFFGALCQHSSENDWGPIECETTEELWKHGKTFHFFAFLMKELRRIQFKKASIGPAVGIYVIPDFAGCSNMHWTFHEILVIYLKSTWTESSSLGLDFVQTALCIQYIYWLVLCTPNSFIFAKFVKNVLSSDTITRFKKLAIRLHHLRVALSPYWFSISSTHWKVRTILNSIINNTTGKYCSVAFIWKVTL